MVLLPATGVPVPRSLRAADRRRGAADLLLLRQPAGLLPVRPGLLDPMACGPAGVKAAWIRSRNRRRGRALRGCAAGPAFSALSTTAWRSRDAPPRFDTCHARSR